MTDRRISQEVADLLYLCGCALRGDPSDSERVSRMDLARVHALASSQSLSALAWYGLESVAQQVVPDDPLMRSWRTERDLSARRQMLFAAERAQILAGLEQRGIWHAPLKGAVLAEWYPRLGMRELTDNDILFDPSRREDVVRLFDERGYQRNAQGHGSSHDDTYTKEPIYNFEMHLRLFSDYDSPVLARYYEDVETRLVGGDRSPLCLRFSREDLYLFLVAHAYKHHQLGGTGVRVLCDLSVLLAHEGADFDWDYVHGELEELGMSAFGQSLGRLVQCVFEEGFDPAGHTAEDAETLCALTSYGTFGTVSHLTEQRLEEGAKRGVSAGGYVLGRLLPDDDWWGDSFPYARDHKWARLPLLVFRSARALVQPERRARIVAELKAILRWRRDA